MTIWTIQEIMEEIADRINSQDDLLAWGCVSKASRLATARTISKYNTKLIPWLLHPPNQHVNNNRRSLFSLSSGKSRDISLSETLTYHCSSSQGWLLITDQSLNLCLLNPTLNNRIVLPPVPRVSIAREESCHCDECTRVKQQTALMHRFNLSVSPTISHDYKLLIFVYNRPILLYYKPGSDWIRIDCSGVLKGRLCDAIFYKDEIYVIDMMGIVIGIDIRTDNSVGYREVAQIYFEPLPRLYVYLVESEGRLLAIEKIGLDCFRCGCTATEKFNVYEVDLMNGKLSIIRDLGSTSVFVGYNSTFSTKISLGLKSNCIYFTDNRTYSSCFNHDDTGVYDLGTRRVDLLPIRNRRGDSDSRFHRGDSGLIFHPCAWIEREFLA